MLPSAPAPSTPSVPHRGCYCRYSEADFRAIGAAIRLRRDETRCDTPEAQRSEAGNDHSRISRFETRSGPEQAAPRVRWRLTNCHDRAADCARLASFITAPWPAADEKTSTSGWHQVPPRDERSETSWPGPRKPG